MRLKTKWLLISMAVLTIAAVVIAKKVILQKTAPESVPTQISKPIQSVFGVGTLEAKEVVILSPKTTARIHKVFADEGDKVTQNQLLVVMDTSELRAVLNENKATILKSRSQLSSAKASIEALRAKKNLADVTLKRYETLHKGGFVARTEYDVVLASAKSADAELESAGENLKLFSFDIEKSQAALKSTEAKLNDLLLRSPFDGVVLSRNAEAGSTVGGGSAILRIANPKTIWVKIYVDERQSGMVKIGQSAVVSLRSLPQKEFEGEVVRIGVESDRITEERPVYVRLMEATEVLHIGEQAEAQIFMSHKSDTNP